IYFSFRDNNYLLYISFILAYAMSQFTYNGLGYQYLWPSGNWCANFSYPFFMSIVFIPMTLFAKSFLQIKKYLPKVSFSISCLIGVYAFSALSEPLVGMKFASTLTTLCSLPTVSIIYFSAIYTFFKGLRSARFFLLGWTVFVIGLIILLLKMLGILPHNFITEYSMQIGSAVEGLLLSLALADRINILKKEKETAQITAIEETKKSESIKTQFLEKTEKLVEKRTQELTKAKNELENLARVDKLTSLYNRGVFDEVYRKEFSRAQRTGNDFSLLIIDVDFFKNFNDRYGHQKGDECLQAVSSCMQKNAQRITDTLARYGGEEFAVILTET
ncbi:MAG: diguanylate cyclase, partial [Desulfobacteraceae bacterium]|nr:diguanylate cyclase [Desulfobacteraceae bacterium]